MSVPHNGNLLIIGISGVTCGGKTTTATQLNNILPDSKIFSQDDYFLDVTDPRHVWIPELNHINFDIITSLDMEKMHDDILHFINKNGLKRINHVEKVGFASNEITTTEYMDIQKFVYDKCKALGCKESKLTVLIVEGFSIFNYEPMLNIFNLKYYFTLEKDECWRRRVTRVYEPPDCPGYFEKCVWPEHLTQLNEIENTVKDITYFDVQTRNVIDKILSDIFEYL